MATRPPTDTQERVLSGRERAVRSRPRRPASVVVVPCCKGVLHAPSNDIKDFMRDSERTTPARIRWGGAAAVLAGASYGAAGYLDKPGVSGYASALVSVLSVATPALFFGGLLGLGFRLGGERSLIRETGFLVGCLGTMLGAIDAVGLEQTFLGLPSIRGWWWALLFVGLTLVGLATLLKGALRLLGALVLASGTLGWVSLLTDPTFPGVMVPMRPVHVAFAALFCLSSVVWGWMLFRGPHSLVRPKS
jgi:hypothetical protein